MKHTEGLMSVIFVDNIRKGNRPEAIELTVEDTVIFSMHEDDEKLKGLTHEEIANAEHVRHCWNHHDPMVEALEAANETLNECVRYLLGTGAIPEPEAMSLTLTQIREVMAEEKE